MSGVVTGAIGLGLSAVQAGASFVQAGKSNKLKREAEDAANKAMMEARKRTETNYYKQLGIQKEAYNQAYEAGLVAQAMQTQQLAEAGQRAAVGVGQLQQAGDQQKAQVRQAQEQEMLNREKLIAGEESRLRDVNVQLDLEEAAGAQQAMADAQLAQNQQIAEGFAGLTDVAMGAVEMAPLYAKQRGAKKKATKAAGSLKGLEGSDNISFTPPGTDRPTIGVEASTMTVDPNMGSSPMEKMKDISIKSGPLKGGLEGYSKAEIIDFQKYAGIKEDGWAGPKTQAKWEEQGQRYLGY